MEKKQATGKKKFKNRVGIVIPDHILDQFGFVAEMEKRSLKSEIEYFVEKKAQEYFLEYARREGLDIDERGTILWF